MTDRTATETTPDADLTPDDLAVSRALGGNPDAVTLLRAHVTATGGETRPQQERMVHAVTDAIRVGRPALIQAGTGTGKSLAYLFAAAEAGHRTVIATATNQLSAQLIDHDLPQVAATMERTGQSFTYAMLKGRSNYACFAGEEELLTSDGPRRFQDVAGQTVTVMDGNGHWVAANISSFGEQDTVDLHLARDGIAKTIRTTWNHRWIVSGDPAGVPAGAGLPEMLTRDLAPGTELANAPGDAPHRWTVVRVTPTGTSEEVFCAVVPTTASFVLTDGVLTGNCKARIAELKDLDRRDPGTADTMDRLFDDTDIAATKAPTKKDSKQLRDVLAWADRTDTGDRSDGPTVPDRIWGQVSVSQADCVGRSCQFFDTCFTEKARRAARDAQIVVTNHALLAQDIKAMNNAMDAGEPGAVPPTLFGPHEVLIVDEVHALPGALTSALSQDLDPAAVDKFLRRSGIYIHDPNSPAGKDSPTLAAARGDLDAVIDALTAMPPGPLTDLPDAFRETLTSLAMRLMTIQRLLADEAAKAAKASKPKRAAMITTMADQAADYAATVVAARASNPGMVRWAESGRHADTPPILKIAPIMVGDQFQTALENRTFIGTSATVSVADDFTPIARALGADHARTDDVGTPFDYAKQGMLYIPNGQFPPPVGRERTAHTAAVLDELTHLVRAAGGRTLALFTTTAGAGRAAEHLRQQFPDLTILAHGDAPADKLVAEFGSDETSVLCATMGLWQGTNIPGPACSLVVIDKVSFAPVDDVLTAARRAYADENGRDGFYEVIVAQAATSLAQAAGRLIRTATDRGVVAILDPRLHTKSYGRTLLASLPPFPRYTDHDTVTGALARLTGGYTPSAAPPETSAGGGTTPSKRRAPRRASTTRKIPHASHRKRSR